MARFLISQLSARIFLFTWLILGLSLFPANVKAVTDKEKPLVISMDRAYSPFTVISPTGEPTGLFVEMWRLWSKQTGVPVEFLVEDWPGSIEAIRDGRADVHSGLFINEQREQWMNFSQPVYEIKTSMFFRTDEDTDLTIEEMAGKKMGALKGSYQLQYLLDFHKDIQTVSFSTGKALVLALLKGEVDAILNENVMVEADLASFGIRGALRQVKQQAFSNFVVAAVRKDRQELLPVINYGFQHLPLESMAQKEKRWLTSPDDRYYERLLTAKQYTPEEEAWIRENPAVTVTVSNFMTPLDIVEEDGSYKGLNSDILSLLSEHTGLKFIPVFKSNWSDLIENIMTGETDVGMSTARTPEREKAVYFTSPYTFVPLLAVVNRNYNEISKWADLNGKRVAVIKGSAISEELRKTIGEKGELIPVKDIAESMDLVSHGEADVLITGLLQYHKAQSASPVKGLKIAARYVGEGGTLRISVHKSKPILAAILDKGLRRIPHQELVDLRNRWLSMDGPEYSGLTTEERGWIRLRKRPIIVGSEMDWPPFDFVKDGRPTGFSNELLRLAAQKAGLPLEFVFGFTWAELMEKFKKGDIDVLPAVYKTPVREKEMALTEYYAANPSVLVGHVKKTDIRSFQDLVGKKLAVVEGFSVNNLIVEKHPRIEQIPFKSVLEALKAVSLKKADAFVGSLGVISHILKENYLPDIRIIDEVSLESPEATNLHMAVLKDRTTLHHIIQKGLDAISEAELNELRTTWLV